MSLTTVEQVKMMAVGSVYDAPEEGFYIRIFGGASLLPDIYYLGSDDLKEMIHNITKYNEWWDYVRKNSQKEFPSLSVCYYESPPLYGDSNKTLKELKKDLEEEGLYDEEEWAEEREECELEKLNLNFCYDAYVFLQSQAEVESKEEAPSHICPLKGGPMLWRAEHDTHIHMISWGGLATAIINETEPIFSGKYALLWANQYLNSRPSE